MSTLIVVIIVVVIAALLLLALAVRIVWQYEQGVVFRGWSCCAGRGRRDCG